MQGSGGAEGPSAKTWQEPVNRHTVALRFPCWGSVLGNGGDNGFKDAPRSFVSESPAGLGPRTASVAGVPAEKDPGPGVPEPVSPAKKKKKKKT